MFRGSWSFLSEEMDSVIFFFFFDFSLFLNNNRELRCRSLFTVGKLEVCTFSRSKIRLLPFN